MLLNTGTELVRSKAGLLTTVCYKFGDAGHRLRARGLDRGHRLGRAVAARPARHHQRTPPRARRWPGRSRTTAASTSCRRSPACSRRTGARDARGAIVGLSRFNTNAHLARATLEAHLLPEPRRRRGDGEGLRRARSRCSRSTAASPPTSCACRSRPTCSASRSAGRWSPRPPRSARRTPPGSPSASGRTPTSCARTGTRRKRWEPDWERGAARGGLRRVEEGGRADPRLGRRRLTPRPRRPAPTAGGSPHEVRRPVPAAPPAALDAMAATSSTCWSSAAAWSARVPPWTPPPAACSVGLVEARDFASGHVEPVQQADPRRPALPGDARLRAWSPRRCRSAAC